jgi:hypothetical protein
MAEHTEGPRVIRCKGSWLEIGRQYGEELRADIAHASRAIEELAMAAGHDRMSLKARINDYIPYAQELPARWDELAGVAQGWQEKGWAGSHRAGSLRSTVTPSEGVRLMNAVSMWVLPFPSRSGD